MTRFSLRGALASFALCVALLTLVTPPLPAAHAQSATFTRKQPTSTASKLISTDSNRSSVLIENVGSVGVAISNVSTVTYVTGFVIAPNQKVVINGAKDQLYGITSASTGDLRIFELTGGAGNLNIERVNTTGAANNASATVMGASDGTDTVNGNVLVYNLSTAITANSTSCGYASGTVIFTSNATGLGSVFRCDGTTAQLLANYSQYNSQSAPVTIATTSTSDMYFTAPVSGTITGIDFSSLDGLTADNTNYITFTGANLGQSGVGTTAVLLVGDANTTKATGGTTITALARRQLTLHGTAGNLAVVKGDVIRIRATATGTLAGAVTLSRVTLYVTRTV